ncbi:MAG TPA: YIP1 family protein [Gammaproteobacteria bacterium]|nr:YIP1 family protein [Gammaproteobacteria bacterium]
MNDASPSAFGSLINIFLEPRKTLEDLRNHAAWWWLPLLLLVVLSIAFQVWYANRVDVSWFADQTLAPSADKMTADQLRDAHARFTPVSMMVFGIIGSVFLVVWYLIQALYFFMAAKVGGWQQQSFGAWLNFISWTSMPALLGFVASAAYMLSTSSRQISPVDIDVTSLNTLLFHVPYAHSGQALASSLRLTTIWSWVLMVIGLSAWTGKDRVKSAIAVLSPYLLCYAVWIAWVAARS